MTTETETDALPITGRCVCEELRYRLTTRPLFTHACHCLDCQRSTGTAFNMTTIIVSDDLVITNGQLRSTHISPRRTSHACVRCNTVIYVSSTAFPSTLTLRPGTLDDTSVAVPRAHIWVCRKQSWLSLSDDAPKFELEYVREDVWPAASLARFERAAQ